ncbi:MAG: NAD(P)/FAD-dependent oxidoreductase [Acidobacteria bacterium]|nr:NAD(P)/FAD-dependent oxidoreductase [Acidobacteriota bacterium]
MFDVIVVGGGPAGLSAALMLGRCRRRVLVCDDARPRNRFSRALHGFLTRDGTSPLELNTIGRAELEKYGVDWRSVHVETAVREGDLFRVTLAGTHEEHARFLLIATGVVDELPPIDGFRECYGTSIFHCPYCDGWENRDRRLAAFGQGKSGVQLALSLTTWSPHVTLLTNGGRLQSGALERLERNGVALVTSKLVRIEHEEGAMSAVAFEDRVEPIDALFFTTGQHPRCDLAETLGCTFNKKGTVETGTLSDTNVPGVFVAGDASRDAQFVVVAAAEGVKAALAINQALQREDLRS